MMTFLLVFLIFLIATTAMAIGVMFNKGEKGELQGSCGGPKVNPHCCQKDHKACPDRKSDELDQ